jgi:two-component system cell cycle sensor histidine kinase/response regulator CckA
MDGQKTYTPRILVVDDEQAILNEFHDILCPNKCADEPENNLGKLSEELFPKSCPSHAITLFDLVLCHQGDEAVEVVRTSIEENKPFAAVFLDVRMPPGPDGVRTAEHIRELDPHIQIVIVTAYSDVDPWDISKRVTPADKLLYIQKPFHPHEVRQFASSLTSKWLAERNLREQAHDLKISNEKLRQEIAEHKRTQEKRDLLARALETTQDCTYITDPENKITFVNHAFCESYGYGEKEIVGKDANILWKDNYSASEPGNAYQGVSGWEVAFYHKRKDGSQFPVSVSRTVVEDQNGNPVAIVVIARDVSERMQIESELHAQIVQFRKQNQLQRESIVRASERLQKPLAELKGIICNAKESLLGEISLHLKDDLHSAETHIEQATRIIDDLRNISRIASDGIKVGVD